MKRSTIIKVKVLLVEGLCTDYSARCRFLPLWVTVCVWQLGHNHLKLVILLSDDIPFMWSSSMVKGLLFHLSPHPHSEHFGSGRTRCLITALRIAALGNLLSTQNMSCRFQFGLPRRNAVLMVS